MIRQLHYTSCRHGRDGIQGFQVAAATPGVPRRHEDLGLPLALYRPAASTPAAPSPAEVAALPVALGFRDFGEVAVLFRSRYLGEDFTGRQGNYFAHLLLLDRPALDLAGLVPAQTWDAPFWIREPVEDEGTTLAPLVDLAAVNGPGPGADVVPRWLDDHCADFTALLAAVRDGLAGRVRRVVVVADGPEPDAQVAAAVLAVTASLPAHLARAVSFTTYCATPDDADLLVVGTMPDAPLGAGGRDRIVLRLGAGTQVVPSAYEALAVERWRAGPDSVAALLHLAAQVRPPLTADELDAFAAAVPLLDGAYEVPGPNALRGLEFLADRRPEALDASMWARLEEAVTAGSAPVEDLARWSAVLSRTAGARPVVESAYLRAVLTRLAADSGPDGLWLPPIAPGSGDHAAVWAVNAVEADPRSGTALRVLRTLERLGVELADADLSVIGDLVLLPVALDPDGDVGPFRQLSGAAQLARIMTVQMEQRLDDELVDTAAEGMSVEAAQWLGDAAMPGGRVALATALRLARAGRRDRVDLVVRHATDPAGLDRLVALVWPDAPPTIAEGTRLLASLDAGLAAAGVLPAILASSLALDAESDEPDPRAVELADRLLALGPHLPDAVRAGADAVRLGAWLRGHPMTDPRVPGQVRLAARASRFAHPALARPLARTVVHRLFEADVVLHTELLEAVLETGMPGLLDPYADRLGRTMEVAEPEVILAVLPVLAHLSVTWPAAADLLAHPCGTALARRKRRVLDELGNRLATQGSVPVGLHAGSAVTWTAWWRTYREKVVTPAEPGLRDRIMRFGRGG